MRRKPQSNKNLYIQTETVTVNVLHFSEKRFSSEMKKMLNKQLSIAFVKIYFFAVIEVSQVN